MNTRFKSNISGFTLVELMIVVAVVAILAALALPTYGAHVEKNRLVLAKSMLNVMRQGVQVVYLRSGSYPANNDELKNVPSNPNDSSDYNRYFQITVNNGVLTASPSNQNTYPSSVTMNIATRQIEFQNCKYTSVCTTLNEQGKR